MGCDYMQNFSYIHDKNEQTTEKTEQLVMVETLRQRNITKKLKKIELYDIHWKKKT